MWRRISSCRQLRLPRAWLPALLACLAAVMPGPAQAQGKLEARYEASLAGIPVGRGSWIIDIGEEQYSAAASGATSGLLKAFAGGSGTGAATGRMVAGVPVPANYAAGITMSKKSEALRIVLSSGIVKDYGIEPPPPVDPSRIAVTEAHLRGVSDPMTGAMLRAPGAGDLMTPDTCHTVTSIFDGRMRYDLKLDFKRVEMVKAEKGYRGLALVCAVYFTPIAGYIPDRAAIKYLAAHRHIEVWLAPIAGTRVLVPIRLTVPTPLGIAMLEATDFVTSAAPPRVAKTQ